tara:strand:- start:1013 stop:1612 length:600 start_codon:yes stop_codon:yes gene_type:complete
MIKAILFDMDGVLIDSYEAWFKLFNFTLKKEGLKEISKKEFDKDVWAQDNATVTKKFFKGKNVKEISKSYFADFMNYTEYLKKMKNAEFVLKELNKKGLKTAVVTNTFNKIATELLTSVGLYDYFDLVIGGDDVEKGKPYPDMVEFACKKLNVGIEDSVLVGDTRWDMLAAKGAGTRFVAYKFDGAKRIDDLKELLEMV